MTRAEELANVKYPIVPLSLPETTPSGEILNSDKALDDFRISIQSFSSNHAFIEGYKQATKDLILTRDDMKYISELYDQIPYMKEEDFYDEMLKRFKTYKGL